LKLVGIRMKLHRRSLLHLAAGAAAFPVLPRVASALDYPTRPVRIIIGFPAGGAADVFARVIGQWLSGRLGQPFVVENRPGVASNLAAEAVAHAPADGYTLLWMTVVNAINASVYVDLNFNLLRDLAPVAGVVRGPGVMEVNPAVPATTVPDFISYAKANPGKIIMATAGSGSILNGYGQLFEMMSGVQMIAVPYRGTGTALPDLISGRAQVMFDPLASSIELIRAGKLRPLAVTTAARSPALPDVPALGEFVPGYEADGWQGVMAPRDTPSAIVETLNRQINAALADPATQARIASFGYAPLSLSPEKFGALIANEIGKWAQVVKFANIKPE
jgi:tripartite-type tricarboxylate transporter receptor subunit TctC